MTRIDFGRCPAAATTRFAPSPTGHLHLGHIVNAVFVWGIARLLGGRVLLRIEDVDRLRSREEYERSILDDLEWLGLAWDGEPERQSDRTAIYEAALASLRQAYHVYACTCSRKDIALVTPAGPDEEARYPGTCRLEGLEPGKGRGTRLELPDDVIAFHDTLLGRQSQQPSGQCGDLLVRDRLGQWTYQFAVTVDDWLQGVNLVIRGQDLLPSTGRQILLARMLGRPEPAQFLHHPLVVDARGRKLSKRDQSMGIRELRAAGWTPERVLGEAARLAGLVERETTIAAGDLAGLFQRLNV
ncbi:MAG: tRNA glutamyl-Q(34) synthetase GluQRS, partial [Gemmatimonadota bacterium]